MAEFREDPLNTPAQPDDEATLIYGTCSENRLSPEKLREMLGIPSGDRIQDYGELSTIGIGGVGAVFAAHEPGLNRDVALKLLRPQYRNKTERIEAFIREARATAQIDHPNIVPVHRMGVFDDVGVYFSMKRVEGETLRMILAKLSEDRSGYRRKYSLRRLIEIFIGACNGVAFAHRHGILHCDLKPGNLMVGDYGEVLVMDWGMARYHCERDQGRSGTKLDLELNGDLKPDEAPSAAAGPVEPPKEGHVVGGTPAFMAPELLTGEVPEATEQSDVYGLGAILYSILTWRNAPFDVKLPPDQLCREVALGRFPAPRKAAPPEQPLPLELEAICLKAMARDRSRRYRSVAELLEDVRNYLDGYPVAAYSPTPIYRLSKLIRRHPLVPSVLMAAILTWFGFYAFQLISNLSQSTSLINLAEFNYAQAREYNLLAQRTTRQIRQNQRLPQNRHNRTLERELLRQLAEMENGYNSALEFISRAPELGMRAQQVQRMTRDIFRSTLELYLHGRDYFALRRVLRQFRGRWRPLFDEALADDPKLEALVAAIDSREGVLDISGLSGSGWLMTIRDANGAVVPLPDGKMAEGVALNGEGTRFRLPEGLYTLEFRRRDGSAQFSCPVMVPLAAENLLSFDFPERSYPGEWCYVPGGEFHSGRSGERSGIGTSMLPSFLIGKYEVTFRDYLKFWKSLPDPALRRRYQGWYAFEPGSGGTARIWNDDGELTAPFRPELPMVGITGEAAAAYCDWLGRKIGAKVRLPTVFEWEKAARGVDGRAYVWGDTYRAGEALLHDHPAVSRYPAGAPPGSFPGDRSGYGAFDMTGNVREIVRISHENGTSYFSAGGSGLTSPEQAQCPNIYYINGSAGDLGFRCVVELPQPEKPVQVSVKQ